jgi:hypothetical protein
VYLLRSIVFGAMLLSIRNGDGEPVESRGAQGAIEALQGALRFTATDVTGPTHALRVGAGVYSPQRPNAVDRRGAAELLADTTPEMSIRMKLQEEEFMLLILSLCGYSLDCHWEYRRLRRSRLRRQLWPARHLQTVAPALITAAVPDRSCPASGVRDIRRRVAGRSDLETS